MTRGVLASLSRKGRGEACAVQALQSKVIMV
jgi:hypothetical protein